MEKEKDKRQKEQRIQALEGKEQLLFVQLEFILEGDDEGAALIDELMKLQNGNN